MFFIQNNEAGNIRLVNYSLHYIDMNQVGVKYRTCIFEVGELWPTLIRKTQQLLGKEYLTGII